MLKNNMTFLEIICLVICVLVTVIAVLTVLIYRNRMKRTMQKMDAMLEEAINGTFTEHTFDETMLSSLEARLNRYLTVSEVSSKNLSTEKDKIKELIADISHQTKTPIANMTLYTQLLLEKDFEKEPFNEEDRKCLDALGAQTDKLSFLITSLVKLSRLETGILTLNPETTQVQKLFDAVKIQSIKKAEEKGVTLTFEKTSASAFFDLKWTTEAIFNLVDNAIKYTPCGGKVHVRAVVHEIFCCIEVSDNGIGIEDEEQAKIFTRFYRSQSVNQREGIGIGLYLTRQILAGEGGYIKVSSVIGKGTVFSACVPNTSNG